jgi:hypothetical protein
MENAYLGKTVAQITAFRLVILFVRAADRLESTFPPRSGKSIGEELSPLDAQQRLCERVSHRLLVERDCRVINRDGSMSGCHFCDFGTENVVGSRAFRHARRNAAPGRPVVDRPRGQGAWLNNGLTEMIALITCRSQKTSNLLAAKKITH